MAGKDEQPTREMVIRVDRGRGLWGLLALALVLVTLVFSLRSCDAFAGPSNPFGERSVDRSQPVVLESIRDLSRYVAASGNLNVVIDLEKDTKFVPPAIIGERTLFVAAGTVDAYVEFGGLDGDALEVSDDRTTVEMTVPRPVLEKPSLDADRSYVFAQKRGLVNRFQSLFGDDGNELQELYQLAEKKLAAAAAESDLVARAEKNTRAMLERLLSALGYITVTVRFSGP